MSIITFHRFLISTAILFCALFAGWAFLRFADAGGPLLLALGIGFALATVGLGYYLANLARFLNRESLR